MDYIKRLLENQKRDRKIVALIHKGKSQSEVARQFQMHRQQVNVIWKKETERGKAK